MSSTINKPKPRIATAQTKAEPELFDLEGFLIPLHEAAQHGDTKQGKAAIEKLGRFLRHALRQHPGGWGSMFSQIRLISEDWEDKDLVEESKLSGGTTPKAALVLACQDRIRGQQMLTFCSFADRSDRSKVSEEIIEHCCGRVPSVLYGNPSLYGREEQLLLFHSGELSAKAARCLHYSSDVKTISIDEMKTWNVDWKAAATDTELSSFAVPPKHQLTDKQKPAIEEITAAFSFTHCDKGVLQMASGTGKTMAAVRLAENESIVPRGNSRILYVVGSCLAMRPVLDEWSQHSLRTYAYFGCAYDTTPYWAEDDDPPNSTFPALSSTDSAKVTQWGVGDYPYPLVCICHYNSLDTLVAAQRQGTFWSNGRVLFPEFDLAIYDDIDAAVDGDDLSIKKDKLGHLREPHKVAAKQTLFMATTETVGDTLNDTDVFGHLLYSDEEWD